MYHAVTKCTDTGQDDFISPLDHRSIIGNENLCSELGKSLFHTKQIPYTIINDCYHLAVLPS